MGGKRAAPHPDSVIAGVAQGQAGRVARWQLLDEGVTRRAIERRLQSGHLHPVHVGVYAVGHPRLDAAARRWAAVLAAGPDAVASHRTAGDIWGLRPDNRAMVDVTSARRLRNRDGLRTHRARLAAQDRAEVGGLPLTSVARTLLDLAAVLRPDDLRRPIENAERHRVFDLASLDDLLSRAHGHRGAGALRRALDNHDPRHLLTRSELEILALAFLDGHRLPRPEVNVKLGPFEVDLLWRHVPLVGELDSWEFHRTREAFERDRARDRFLAARGVQVIRLTHRALTTRASRTAAEIAAALARAEPRPPLPWPRPPGSRGQPRSGPVG